MINYQNLIRGAVLQAINGSEVKFIFIEANQSAVKVIPIEDDGFASKFIWTTGMAHFFKLAPEESQLENLFGASGVKFNLQLYVDYLLHRVYQKNENEHSCVA
jgi:hypothetical protein